MKIAISGKGGSGKTTVSVFLAMEFAREKPRVFLVDADPDGNLPIALGLDDNEISGITPIVKMKELIAERTGASGSGYFKLNPEVSDIPEKYSVKKNGVHLLVLGTPRPGGTGCYCPENAFLKSLLRHIFLRKEDIVILDMPAGIEHLGRGTAESVDCLITVTEPTAKSIQTARRVKDLSKDIGIKNALVMGNKITGKGDIDFIRSLIPEMEIVGYISYNKHILDAEQKSSPVYIAEGDTSQEILQLKKRLEIIKTGTQKDRGE